MWRINKPDNSKSIGDLITALTLVNGTPVYALSSDEIDRIAALYDHYDTNGGNPHPAFESGGLALPLCEALYSAYAQIQQGGRLAALRAILMEATDRCPVCGIGAVTDLDHHLPRASFFPFAVYIRNLVPYCGTCNNAKRSIGRNPGETFAHPYFANFPNGRFFAARCVLSGGALTTTFSVTQIPGMSDELHAQLCFQYKRLRLNARYDAEINVFLGSHAVSLADAYGADRNPSRVADWARRSAAHLERSFGLNDWRPAVLHGIAACPDFCAGGFMLALGVV
jgi:hypothetical protein